MKKLTRAKLMGAFKEVKHETIRGNTDSGRASQ
jgi:hypothetical protein